MKRKHASALTLAFAAVVILVALVWAQSPSPQPPPADPGWPRIFKEGANQVTVYQPQVDSWEGYTSIRFRCAIAVTAGSGTEEKYGVAEISADTVVDTAARTVVTHNHKREIRFPNVPDSEAATLRQVVDKVLPVQKSLTVNLDRVLAYLQPDKQTTQQPVDVNVQPPKIFYSSKPAILVIFMGPPELKPVIPDQTDLMCAVNTNWDVFYSAPDQRYYLLKGDGWLTAPDALKGPWTPAKKLPAALSKLPANDNWADVSKNVPGKPVTAPPAVFAVAEPCELIVTKGEPSFSPVTGTKLMSVANTTSVIFLHSGEKQYYFLVAGRWFRAKNLNGPWSAASSNLPADFAKIPDDSPFAYVKASVPGTREAADAVLLASVPKTTSLNRTAVTDEVVYTGDPKFVVIEGTTAKYASNTSSAVFLVEGAYYWCYQGAWLTSPSPSGPWEFATVVPAAIYTIPSSHPAYNVTYVVVQSSTPTTVTYAYTSGYSGEYVAANGVLMFGIGLLVGAALADDYYYYHYHGPIYPWGCGAVYHYGYGGYYRAAHYYGPYGGAGCGAAYNPHTGTYSRGAYAYGPAGSAGYRQAYNPYTGAYAQGGRVNTAYGSAGRFYAEKDGESAWGGYRSTDYGSVAGVRTSEGSGAVAWDTASGQGVVAKDQEGNIYAGSDGTVYKRDENGEWSSNSGSGWESASKPQPTSANKPTATTTGKSPQSPSATTTANRNGAQASSANPTVQGLNKQAEARQWGNQQSQRASQFRSGAATPAGSGTQRARPTTTKSGGGRRAR